MRDKIKAIDWLRLTSGKDRLTRGIRPVKMDGSSRITSQFKVA